MNRIDPNTPRGRPEPFGMFLVETFLGGLESSRKANIEGRLQRIARFGGGSSLPGKRILKDVRRGLLGYGGFRAYPESEY